MANWDLKSWSCRDRQRNRRNRNIRTQSPLKTHRKPSRRLSQTQRTLTRMRGRVKGEGELPSRPFFLYFSFQFVPFFRSTFHRIVETADIISQLAKNTKSSSAKIKKPIIQSSSTLDATSKIHKFKTSGIVATAAVAPRKYRRSITQQTPMPLQTTTPSLKILNDCNTDSEQENNVKIPLKRATKKSLRLFKESASRKLEKTS